MQCSMCKKDGHNNKGCPFIAKCKKCGRKGHTTSKCSYKTVYDSIPCLSRDIINLIMDSKAIQEEEDHYRDYFSRIVCKQIRAKGGFYGYICLDYSRPIAEKTLYYLNLHTREDVFTKEQKLENAIRLYEHFYEYRWLIMKYYHMECTNNLIKSVYDKLIGHLFIHKMRNCNFYVDMFEHRNENGECKCMICSR